MILFLRRLSAAVLIFLLVPCPLSKAQTDSAALPLSLREALQLARERHVEVIVAEERVQQALTRITQARSPLLPQIKATASQLRETRNLEAVGIQIPGINPVLPPFNSFDARLALTQTIFDATALERLRSARVEKLVSLAEVQKTKEDVMALVADLYLEAERAQEAIPLARSLLRQSEERLRLARSRLQLGLGPPLDVTNLEAERAQGKSRLVEVSKQAVEKRLDLAAALGLPAEKTISFAKEDIRLPASAKDPTQMILPDHPDVELAQRVVEQSKAEKKVAQADYYPKISGQADYGASGNDPTHADDTYTFGGGLSVPLYAGGLRRARVRETASQIRESEARLVDTQRQTEARVLSARETLERSSSLLKATQSDLSSARKQLSVANERLRSGLGTSLEVVEAETQLAQASDRESDARATYRLAQVNLVHAIGKMESLIDASKDAKK
jgi:outer membrane protein